MKPILFNTEMVKAILEGRKTVTRRLVKLKYRSDESGFQIVTNKATGEKRVDTVDEDGLTVRTCIEPPYHVGDVLYVRETWCKWYCYDCGMCDGDGSCEHGNPLYDTEREEWFCYCYKANGDADPFDKEKWRPSIHMPKEAARLFLRVTDVRVERLQDMTLDDFKAEGTMAESIVPEDDLNYRFNFANLWDGTIKTEQLELYGWSANPFVWVIEFEVTDKPVEEL